MYKKIIIPIMVFVGVWSMAFYQIGMENKDVHVEKGRKKAGYEPIVVLELFTSQGCSSCPPADMLLDKAKSDYPQKVFALSYHVDYWNYIGWKDPFSQRAYSIKQRAYNQKFKSNSNYTPQMVVNGLEHLVGSNQAKLASKIKYYSQKETLNEITISNIKKEGPSISFEYGIQGNLEGKSLRAVVVLNQRITSVNSGENRNRALKNSNIVVAENYSKLNTELGNATIVVPSFVKEDEAITLILIVEKDNLTITAAAKGSV